MHVPGLQALAGRFDILGVAGVGGMGVVYHAIHRTTGRPVALKLLQRKRGDERQRFLREGKLLAALEHPNIVELVDRGTLESGEHYLAMEWLEGETLAERLDRGALSLDEALSVATQIAHALATAHAAGIVHRDLKPANIFLVNGSPEAVKVLDFGIARTRGGTMLTAATDMIGTPGYMAPEQILASSEVTAATDCYALGCILFRALAGRAPFEGESAQALIVRAAAEAAPRLSAVGCYVPPALDALVAALLDQRPENRPHDGEHALRLLRAMTPHATRRTPPRWVLGLVLAIPLVAIVFTVALLHRDGAEQASRDDRSETGGVPSGRKSRRRRSSRSCDPEARCVEDALRPPRMKLDDLYRSMIEATRRELGGATITGFTATDVDCATMTAATEYAILQALHGNALWSVKSEGAALVFTESAKLAAPGPLSSPRCLPSELLRGSVPKQGRMTAVVIGLGPAPGHRIISVDLPGTGPKALTVDDTCPDALADGER